MFAPTQGFFPLFNNNTCMRRCDDNVKRNEYNCVLLHWKVWVPMMVIICRISLVLRVISSAIFKSALGNQYAIWAQCQLLIMEVSQWLYVNHFFVSHLTPLCIYFTFTTPFIAKILFWLLLCPCYFWVAGTLLYKSSAVSLLLASLLWTGPMSSVSHEKQISASLPSRLQSIWLWIPQKGNELTEKRNTASIVAEHEQQHIERLSWEQMNGDFLKNWTL